MGAGIAQVAATKGLQVLLCDSTRAAIERGLQGISTSLARLVKKGTVTQQDADEAIKRIQPTEDLDVGQPDLHCLPQGSEAVRCGLAFLYLEMSCTTCRRSSRPTM